MEVESVILSAAERFSSPMQFDWAHDFVRDRTKMLNFFPDSLAIMLT